MLGTNIQPVSSPATIYSWADLGFAGTVEEGWGCAWDELYFHGTSIQLRKNTAIVLWF